MKLNKRGAAVVRLALWAGTLTWIVMFLGLGVTMAQRFATIAPDWFGTGTWGQTLTWIAPIWVVFTSLLVCVYVARFVSKKLQPKEEEEERLVNEAAVGELSRNDVKAIASSRFSHKWAYWLIGVGFVGFIALGISSWLVSNQYVSLIPMIIIAAIFLWYLSGSTRAQRRAVEKWEEERDAKG